MKSLHAAMAMVAACCVGSATAAPPLYPDKMNLLVLRDAQGKETPITTADQWAKRREHILANMQEVMKAAQPVYDLLQAKDKLQANYPDCKHDFPEESRKVAYAFLDRWLKK